MFLLLCSVRLLILLFLLVRVASATLQDVLALCRDLMHVLFYCVFQVLELLPDPAACSGHILAIVLLARGLPGRLGRGLGTVQA